jgi:FMN-dependent NADH-azoreductase
MAQEAESTKRETMKNILVIESSSRGSESLSGKLTQVIVEKLKAANPASKVKTRNLGREPFPHLDESRLASFFAPPEKHTSHEKDALRLSDQAISELLEADVIVIGVAVYNFTIPSALKTWIDHVARAGHTFKYGEHGTPEGLVKGKKVYLAVASGGVYSEGHLKAFDFAVPYLYAILGFLGMTDVHTFRAEGTAIPNLKETALSKAIESVRI